VDEPNVRERAEALCSALVAGDVDRVTEDFSEALRHNLGEVLALFMLPSDAATIEAVERAASSGFTVRLRLVGSGEVVVVETRWKERDGRPTIIEVSHLSRAAAPEATDDGEPTTDPEGLQPTT
jgi:hypothetical protein